jgi:hypothetical protein
MDGELRAKVYATFDGIPGVDAGDFLSLYCKLHRMRFGTEFFVKQ